MPRRQRVKHLTLEDIHRAVAQTNTGLASVSDGHSKAAGEAGHSLSSATKSVETRTVSVVTSAESSPLDDALQKYFVFSRPTETSHLEELVGLVGDLIRLCGTSSDDWKVFVLTAFCRRYHSKAPQAKKQANKKNDTDEKDSDSSDQLVGDGERLLFYVTLLSLHHFGYEDDLITPPSATSTKKRECAQAAMTAMVQIAAQIGGTRDLNAIIEALSFAMLLRHGHVSVDGEQTAAPGAFKDKLVPALHEMAAVSLDAPLQLAVNLAAQQLDQDFGLLKDKNSTDDANTNTAAADTEDLLLSTIHVTIPHNKRGSNTAQGWQRKLANSFAEMLIWQRCSVAQNDQRFSAAKALLQGDSSIKRKHELIQMMQTTIRKKRKLLNDHARTQGFMLASSYLSDKTSLRLRHLRRGKAGDLDMLLRLAKKQRDTRMIRLLLKRNLDKSKPSHFQSISQLAANWIPIPDPSKQDNDDAVDDEITAMELEIQAASVNATIERLRPAAKDGESVPPRPVLVTSMGYDRDNAVCAILVAAALDNSHLLLNNGEEYDVSTAEKCVDLLNQVIANGLLLSEQQALSIEDIISTKLAESQDMIVLSSTDLELDEHVLQDLQARDITLRVHATKRIATSSSNQPVVLELNSEIVARLKAGAPLSLAVVLDCTGSMGREIEGCKRGAVKLISMFRELAPVKYANFMGYWDPVNVRTDPQPKSTGYLDPNQNMDRIQKFVDTELKCQGGGDEPEDIPKALEALVADFKKAGLSASTGVHFVFFIADAGFRSNENARVRAALKTLREMGIVMVMCPVRGMRGSMRTMVERSQEYFQNAGQFVQLENVGELESIAVSVTESIRASLFSAGNVVSVTSSVGDTIDAVAQLANVQRDHSSLKKAQELTTMPSDDEEEDKGEAMSDDDEEAKDTSDEAEETKNEAPRVFAGQKEFKLTSRDRLYLQLSRLPAICHESLASTFGGGRSLQEIAAAVIAERLMADDIPVAQVSKAGYPSDVVAIIRNMVGGHGIQRNAAGTSC